MPHLRTFALITSLALSASASATSSVWKITKGDRELYLGGTCHVLRTEDFPLPPEFDAAFVASDRIIFETDLARAQGPEMQALATTRGVFTDGRTLADVLTPTAWKTVEQYCAQAGLPLAQFAALKPWLFTLVVSMSELQRAGVTQEGVDLYYHKRAVQTGKPVGQLETLEQQIEFIVNLGAGHESEMVVHTIEDLAELPEMLHGLISAWKSGDEAQVDRVMLASMRERYPAIHQDLVVDRNEAWLPKLAEMLETPEIEFVLVGVGHLAGPQGVLASLRERGYTVTQLDVPEPEPAASAD